MKANKVVIERKGKTLSLQLLTGKKDKKKTSTKVKRRKTD